MAMVRSKLRLIIREVKPSIGGLTPSRVTP